MFICLYIPITTPHILIFFAIYIWCTLQYIIVVLRSYIAGLRDQLIEHKVAAERAADPEDDGHAHYHGHEKCTAGELIFKC